MIRNILFDMTNVLFFWEPDAYLDAADVTGTDRTLLRRATYFSKYWQMLDRGSVTPENAIRIIKSGVPERLWDKVDFLMTRWPELIRYNTEMLPLMRTLQRNGYGTYLLTNTGIIQKSYWPGSPFGPFFEGRVLLSASHGLLKPCRDFYDRAIDLFRLLPDECVFVDDSPANVESAEFCGFNGVVFYDEPQLIADLTALGVNLGGLEEEKKKETGK